MARDTLSSNQKMYLSWEIQQVILLPNQKIVSFYSLDPVQYQQTMASGIRCVLHGKTKLAPGRFTKMATPKPVGLDLRLVS